MSSAPIRNRRCFRPRGGSKLRNSPNAPPVTDRLQGSSCCHRGPGPHSIVFKLHDDGPNSRIACIAAHKLASSPDAVLVRQDTIVEGGFMVRRAILMLTLLSMAVPMFAKEAIIPISAVAGGANGTLFRTDVRLFNPSATKDITIQAQFLPSGTDNTAVQPRTITIVKRQMSVMNNIVSSFFAASGTGAIDLKSDDDFVVTSRTYTDSPNAAAPGTFGQFIAAYDPSAALTHGVLLHLANSSDLTQGFRTNTGFMNVNTTPVTVTLGLYASDSTLVKAATFGPIPPRSVLQQGLAGILGVNPLDFPDGYVTFSATAPVLGYSSVVDNRSSDQIFVPAQARFRSECHSAKQ